MKKSVFVALAAVLLLSGCGSAASQEEASVTINHYDKLIYKTTSVEKGDFIPKVVLNLNCDSYNKHYYSLENEEMEVDNTFVSVGDRVSEGDVLLTCKSGEIEDNIDIYEKRISRNQLVYEHYKSVLAIDSTDSNKVNLEQLKRTIDVDTMYVAELRAKLATYNIVADADGIVFDMAEGLDQSTVGKTHNIITVIYSDGIFTASSDTRVNLSTEEIYEASYESMTYKIKYISETEDRKRYIYTFQVINDNEEFCAKEKLVLEIVEKNLQDVLYVPANCVVTTESGTYVYVLDENGYREAKEVTVDTIVEGNYILSSGVSEGDEVVINEIVK